MPAQTIAPLPTPTVLGWIGEHPILTTILIVVVLHMITVIIKALGHREIKIPPIEIRLVHVIKRAE